MVFLLTLTCLVSLRFFFFEEALQVSSSARRFIDCSSLLKALLLAFNFAMAWLLGSTSWWTSKCLSSFTPVQPQQPFGHSRTLCLSFRPSDCFSYNQRSYISADHPCPGFLVARCARRCFFCSPQTGHLPVESRRRLPCALASGAFSWSVVVVAVWGRT